MQRKSHSDIAPFCLPSDPWFFHTSWSCPPFLHHCLLYACFPFFPSFNTEFEMNMSLGVSTEKLRWKQRTAHWVPVSKQIFIYYLVHLSHETEQVARHTMGTQSLQSCLTLCNPADCSPPGSSVHGILHVRILEWVTMPSARGSSWPRDQTHVPYVSSIGRWVLYH